MTISLRGSHGLSARRARRTKSRGPKGLQLEVGARSAPKLLEYIYIHMSTYGGGFFITGGNYRDIFSLLPYDDAPKRVIDDSAALSVWIVLGQYW